MSAMGFLKLLCVLIVANSPLLATSLISVFCEDGISMAVDTGQTGQNVGGRAIKSVLLRNRYAVGTVHLIRLHQKVEGRTYEYEFVNWINSLDAHLENPGLSDLAQKICTEAKNTFYDFGILIRRGVLRKEFFNNSEALAKFMVVGYEGEAPAGYLISVLVDWDTADTSRVICKKLPVDLSDGIFFQAAGSTAAKEIRNTQSKVFNRVLQVKKEPALARRQDCDALAVAIVKVDAELDSMNVTLPVRLITLHRDHAQIEEIN